MPYLNADKVEENVMGHVLFYLRHPQNILKNLNPEADPSRLKEIETKLKGVNISIGKLEKKLANEIDAQMESAKKIDQTIIVLIKKNPKKNIAALDNQKEEKGKLESQLLAFRENLGEVKVVEEGATELRKMGQFVTSALQKMTHQEKHEFLISIFGLRKIKVLKMLLRRRVLSLKVTEHSIWKRHQNYCGHI